MERETMGQQSEEEPVLCDCPPDAVDDDGDSTCPHWCIEDVPTNRLADGDIFAIRGDLPLEVSWHVVAGAVDPMTGTHHHHPIHSPNRLGGPSTPFDPAQPTPVLRFGMVGRQTLEPTAEVPHWGSIVEVPE